MEEPEGEGGEGYWLPALVMRENNDIDLLARIPSKFMTHVMCH